ncbi:MAG: hypothetical protein AMR96_05685 [Candidatus Adiutrix intracellularis]|jgi:hypothetical protein|nr:MAG: hypothetical protein AMR96_05685 [Candidatus Adiutrix intracellularis]MDR2826988.1 hypothetical protein [Candidatus Adiutrix intracellularis]
MSFWAYLGVEAGIYDWTYGLKVQFLIRFNIDKLPWVGVFLTMMDRIYDYRAKQFLNLLGRLVALNF